MSDSNLTIDDLNALPEKMRAHAAAKAVGMTSKEFLAAMAGIGVEVRSAQSGVTREVLLTWFASRGEGGAPASEAAPAVDDAPVEKPSRTSSAENAPAEKAPAKKAAAKKASAEKAPAKKAPAKKAAAEKPSRETSAEEPSRESSAEEAPAKKAPARKARKAAAEKTAPAAADGPTAEPTTGKKSTSQAPVRRPLPEMSIVTGEVGTAEPGNRRRSTATPSFSPLFLSPDEAAAKAERERPARTKSGGPETSRTGQTRTGQTRPDQPNAGTTDETGTRGDSDTPGTADIPGTADAPETTDASKIADASESTDTNDDQNDNGEGGSRRRRRGRRGRGRGRGENFDDQNGEDDENDASTDDSDDARDDTSGDRRDQRSGGSGGADRRDDSGSADTADGRSESGDESSEDDSDDSDGSPSGSRRRRRRRRRGGGSGNDDTQASGDDSPDTEVQEQREPRRRPARGGQSAGAGSSTGTSADEVQGITGSTRLEAKRQRRRDGRDAGRRRQPILSESEFLARRESVDRVMVVREKQRGDGKGIMTQVGVLEDKVLVEHFVTTESARSMVGNVYLGRVQNVLPSMEAAFVDIGRGRNGVLYAGEVNWEAAGLGGKARRIEQALRPGDMVLVQVTKDPIGQKGARLTTQISLAGRFLVYVPDGNSTGISRKLPDTERRRLKAILKDVVPEGSGVIIRTAAEGVSEEEIGRDVERLAAQWAEIAEASAKRTSAGAGTPVALYEEPDLLVKVVRDLFNEDFSSLVIQGDTSWDTVHDYVSKVAPEMTERLERYDNPDVDVFATHRVDEQVAKALDRKVWLPSGGSLVIDRTEAMTVIDVNTGKYTGSGGNLEETVTKNNLEAAEEIVRQLRLRDVGGMVIIDFIDMVLEANRDLVLRRLTEALGRDRTRHQVSEVTSLGLVQLTRKKLGTGLVEAFSTPCEHCQGRGLIVHADPVHTESHNADEPGNRRGRKRGGKGAESDQPDTATPSSSAQKQTPKKDGPAPAAHPAALAISRQEAAQAAAEKAARPEVVTAEPSAPATTASATAAEPDAPASTVSAEISGTPDSEESDAGVAESADAAGSRPGRRRRRATRRPADGAIDPVVAAEDAAVAETAETPEDEAAVVAEAAEAVQTVEATEPSAQAVPDSAAAGGGSDADARSETAGRRPRRRSTRREAGAAVAQATEGESAPVAVVPVEAAPLAEAPPVVVAEPRQRPARRRATRSTTAPEGGDH
ncbi:ribonuclease E/G [Dietzia psychralcaliphila]|uniref:Ribonuclease E n=2 Tax=Dietzia psychralcaliphila TaxID=139021 RepID=A0AAD0JTC4_9ACTN|nr:ribonuclease E/G [Dietzia psychralcaliphila]AWH95041.1 ribonuclease [Dietzia psychralcaliphila]PTM87247.1 ribonuclease E [Dietzia psychralcaliphila]